MITKILASTEGKTFACPAEKIRISWSAKECNRRIIKPQLFVEEPSRFPVPVTVHYSKQYAPKFQEFTKRSGWRSRKQPQYEPKPKLERFNICRWYKRKKAFRQLVKENQRKEKEAERRKREEWEKERVNDILRWEFGKRQREIERKYKETPRPIPLEEKKKEITIKESKYKQRSWPPSVRNKGFSLQKKRTKKTEFKERSVNVKPRSVAKQVSVKKYNGKYSIRTRLINCWYRICCQIYCYLTCLIVIVFVVILLL